MDVVSTLMLMYWDNQVSHLHSKVSDISRMHHAHQDGQPIFWRRGHQRPHYHDIINHRSTKDCLDSIMTLFAVS